jgi:hypothetical protein
MYSREKTIMSQKDINPVYDYPQQTYGDGQSKQNKVKLKSTLKTITTADDKLILTEPSSPYHSEYPYNNVTQTLSGHVREVDDTPGSERIFEMHKSGTFFEIHPDGTKVSKIFSDNFSITIDDNNIIVGGNLNITVEGDANILVKGNVREKIKGNKETFVNGDYTTKVKGNYTLDVDGSIHKQVKNNYDIRAKDIKLFAENKITFLGKDVSTSASGSILMTSKVKTHISSDVALLLRSGGVTSLWGSPVSMPTPVLLSIDPLAPNININKPEYKKIKFGYSIEDTLVDPAFSYIRYANGESNYGINFVDPALKYPKDRKKDG